MENLMKLKVLTKLGASQKLKGKQTFLANLYL